MDYIGDAACIERPTEENPAADLNGEPRRMRAVIMGTPKGKGRPRFSLDGHVYTPKGTREAEENIRAEFIRQNPNARMIERSTPVAVDIVAFFGVPKSATKAERQAISEGKILHTKKPDADNVLKLVCDALNGVAWEDDAQIVEMRCEKRYGAMPMTCIVIEEAKRDERCEGQKGTVEQSL